VEFGQFCHGEPRNFANWPAEFGKIFRGKLWAVVISVGMQPHFVTASLPRLLKTEIMHFVVSYLIL